MSDSGLSSSPSASLAVRSALKIFDPRRWLGTLFALAGVIVSVIVMILPSSLVNRVYRPSTRKLRRPRPRSVPVPHNNSLEQSPRSPVQSFTMTHRPVRNTSINNHASPPSNSFLISESHPGSLSYASIFASSPSDSSFDPVLHETSVHSEVDLISPGPVSKSSVLSRRGSSSCISLVPVSPLKSLRNSAALKSLDCLDLATPEFPPPLPVRTPSQSSKRPFRLPLPKLGFGKRRSLTNLRGSEESISSASLSKSNGSKEAQMPEDTVKQTDALNHEDVPAKSPTSIQSSTPMPRRRFTLFSREGRVREDNGKIKDKVQPSSDPKQAPVPSTPQNIVSSPGRSVLQTELPISPLEGSSSPLVLTQTPPARPFRTDPYKTHGVPFPGSERARAFFRAEKEMRAAREKRIRAERSASVDMRDWDKGKGKGPPEHEANHSQKREEQRGSGESGAMPSPPPPPPPQTGQASSSSHKRRGSWCPGRRRTEVPSPPDGESQKPRLQKDNNKSRDRDPARPKTASKLRDLRIFSTKERGYLSDTGVPSLTYKLM